jgi:methylated-DNA-[protein]-cysteine S-methyltransferase
MTAQIYYRTMESPIGRLLLTATDAGISGLFMQNHKGGLTPETDWVNDLSRFTDAVSQLEAYFAGELREFQLKLDLHGTPFQVSVWKALLDIPFGETRSYAKLARAIGNPAAVRAVGLANGRNPVSIIVPCHRVIGSDGSLTGYGGGLDRKRFLLDFEARVAGAKVLQPSLLA